MLSAIPYGPSSRQEWDGFVRDARNGHFLFHRDYMEYHADRFPDASLMFYDERGRLTGLLPATIREGVVSSHAGLSFGGVITTRTMKVELMLELFQLMCAWFRDRGASEILYKPVPHIYHQMPAEEDIYALFRAGARLVRRDVSATIDRRNRLPLSEMRKRAVARARGHGLEVQQSTDYSGFIALMDQILQARYGVHPTHSAAEMKLLAGRFPDNIRLFVTPQAGQILAGVIIYETARVAHAQYIGASEQGRETGALDLIFEHLICERYADKDYFDFGISTEDDGHYLNAGLINNKESYGARATVLDWYSIDLTSSRNGLPDQAG
jgi:GNAT acetyltransferase-like protein